ncbi:hypothetical protein RXV94_07345 [Yeosuana sp. MJ-SS3]|uniref:Uncharacterized protein n=1 Tax=Gilvirhabdus luticola TaxID=3079858 RepID=A0ABU3U6K9_9FLAO|nr:hypothetical protein [Yeosuana sp. MJ-SS3]MDU8885971.1 hypothetical protein [Yeosuana sp. MJ-SS3]
MKKILLFVLTLVFTSTAFGQIAYLQYRKVPADQEAKFVERETKYWSKVAKSAIDKGQLAGWSLWKKVGVTKTDAPNYVFVNSYVSLDQLDQNFWGDNMDALGDVKPQDVETMSFTEVPFDYFVQFEDNIAGDYKYAIVNYGLPTSVGDFIQENKTLWKPFHENNIKNGNRMTAWGMASVVYPSGNQNRFSVFTYDGFNKLSDALDYLRYQDYSSDGEAGPFADIISKSKMNELLPDGFNYRIIYERIMSVE